MTKESPASSFETVPFQFLVLPFHGPDPMISMPEGLAFPAKQM
jgi:hypothetical protein